MASIVQGNIHSDKVMSREEAIWLACALDCEGTVSLYAAAPKGNRVSPHVTPLVRISNTEMALIERACEVSGNGVVKKQETVTRPVYVWQCSPRQAAHILPQVVPFLVVKRRRAELVLELLSLRGHRSRGLSRDDMPRVTEILEEVRSLNQKGKHARLPGDHQKDRVAARGVCSVDGCGCMRYDGNEWCYRHWIRNRPPEIRRCANCGTKMECATDKKRFCSNRCQQVDYQRRRQAQAVAS